MTRPAAWLPWLCAALLAHTSASSVGASANDYAQDPNWLCRPGRSDVCSAPTTSTLIDADGSRRVLSTAVASDPPIDCFYVYPTVSRQPGANSDMASTGVEEATAEAQFAPFAAQCRTFAPRYRQVTLAGLHAALSGGARPDTALAYRDVLDAWRHYLANDSHGRGVVLIGHSQGAKILTRLIADEIDGRPVQARLVSAIVPGTLVELPAKPGAGGTFASIPPCAAAADTGCVIAYSTYLRAGLPVERPMFGVAEHDNRRAACVDPARLVGNATLAAELPSRLLPAMGIETSFVGLPGLLGAECVTRGRQTVLAVSTADDPRAAPAAQGLAALQARRPGWGLHTLDINLALGDLVTLVGAQGRAWAQRKAPP